MISESIGRKWEHKKEREAAKEGDTENRGV